MSDRSLNDLDIPALAKACREVTDQRILDPPDYCLELFRRAFEDGDDKAWDTIARQYMRLIYSWVLRSQSGSQDQEEVTDLANEALARFWRTLSARITDNFTEHFDNTASVLGYLNRCVVSVVQEKRRQVERVERLKSSIQSADAISSPSYETVYSEKDARDQLVEQVRAWLAAEVTDPTEQLLVELTWVYDMPPRTIVERFPILFPDARAVRRVKERILKRARRSLTLSENLAE